MACHTQLGEQILNIKTANKLLEDIISRFKRIKNDEERRTYRKIAAQSLSLHKANVEIAIQFIAESVKPSGSYGKVCNIL